MLRTFLSVSRTKIVTKVNTIIPQILQPKMYIATGTAVAIGGKIWFDDYKRKREREKWHQERLIIEEKQKKQEQEEVDKIKSSEDAEEYAKIHKFQDYYVSKIPEKFSTTKIYEQMIRETGELWRVPKEKRTKELCNLAFEKDIKNFKYIPDEFKSYWMRFWAGGNESKTSHCNCGLSAVGLSSGSSGWVTTRGRYGQIYSNILAE